VLVWALIYHSTSSTASVTVTVVPHHSWGTHGGASTPSCRRYSSHAESEDRRCGGQVWEDGYGVDTARRTWKSNMTVEEGFTIVDSKCSDYELDVCDTTACIC
jgi:hypothetical protein